MLRLQPTSTLFPYTTLFRSVGFIAAWSNWIAIVSVIPVEAEASVQYMASWPYPWAQSLYVHAERSEEHTSELQSHVNLVCRLLLEKKNRIKVFCGSFLYN